MDFTFNIIINTYSILILVVISIQSYRDTDKNSWKHRIFGMMLKLTMFLLVMDIFGRFDGKTDALFPFFNHLGNFMLYMLNPVLPSLWLLYAHHQIFHSDKKTRRLLYPLCLVNIANVILVICSLFYGWYYTIDSNNIYHRGPLFLLPSLITVTLILAAFIMIIAHRKKIEKRHFLSLLLFGAPPFPCALLQIYVYGVSIVLHGAVISLLIGFLNIQNYRLYTDYLTGVGNRKKLEAYLDEKIAACTADKTFSAILIDINDFKAINDNFGHHMGDDALETTAELLRNYIRPVDLIARFGGDEFFMVLETSNAEDLDRIIQRIKNGVDNFNNSGVKPYKLGFSIGYAVYDYTSGIKANEFEKQIDALMYEDKRKSKNNTSV